MSREQLLELVQWLLAEQVRLRAEIEQLKRNNARAAAPFSKNQRKKNPPRPGRKAGQGTFRHRPAPPAEEYTGAVEDVPVTSTHCPDCGGVLVGDEEEIVTQTELPPTPKPDIKAYRIQIRSCCRCQRKVRGAHPEVSPDQYGATAHRLGPRAQAALRLGTGDGPVAQQYEQLRGQIKEQPAINTDDTGWRIGGETAHLMVFESQPLVVYQIRPRHRNEEVREVIGDHDAGTLCTDRGKSYDAKKLDAVQQQKCLSHILRSLDAVLESKSGRAQCFGMVLKAQLKEARQLYKTCHVPEQKLDDYAARVQALELEISWQLRPRRLADRDNQRLLKELGRHHERSNLLRFLHEPQTVAPRNNAAERALRPAVIARKVSPYSKNQGGAAAYAAFKSVIGTLKKSGGEVLAQLTRLLAPPQPALENTC